MKPIQIDVIIVSGRLGSGKNHISEKVLPLMLPPKPTLYLAFANHFKIEAIVKDNLDREKVFGDKDDKTRVALQLRGTEEGRNVFGENIWLDMGLEWLYMYLNQGYERVFITDGRFPNEIDEVMVLNGRQMTIQGKTYEFAVTTIRVNAPGRSLARVQGEANKNNVPVEKIAGHFSETALDNYKGFTYVVANDYEDNVYPAIKAIARELTERSKPEVVYVVDIDDTICECGVYYEDVIKKARQAALTLLGYQGVPEDSILSAFKEAEQKIYARVHAGLFRREQFAEDIVATVAFTLQACGSILSERDADDLYQAGIAVFDQPYYPFPGAIEAVRALQGLGKVVLYTHGDRVEQATKVAKLGLSDLAVYITPNKNEDSLRQLMFTYPAHRYTVVGDNIKRDALAALNVGGVRVYWIDQGRPVPTGLEFVEESVLRVSHLSEVVDGEKLRLDANVPMGQVSTDYAG